MRDDLDPDGCRRLAAAVIGKAVAHEGLPYTASRDFDLSVRDRRREPGRPAAADPA